MLTSIVFFLGNLVVYSLFARVLPRSNRLLLFFVLGSIAGVLLLGFEFGREDDATIQLFASAFSYALMCAVFLSCLGMSLTSVSASLLMKLRQNGMDEEEIGEMYSSDLMVSLRLDRMVNGGFLRQGGDRFQLTSKGLRLVKTFQFFQTLFRHRKED